MKKIRVACMVRVSHEEQVRDGLSIQTQIEHLKKYVDEHEEMVLVDFYIDEGISADKLNKRLQFQRLLKDVQEDKIDLIIFTKLDRWFRSVEKYYQVQPILDKHKVTWRATQEDYETETASGRFKVNIMLSVAQNERERTSERIKDVFQYKVKQGETLWGYASVPFGFEIENKHLIHNKETEHILYDAIEYYLVNQSMRKTYTYLREQYGIYMDYKTLTNLFKNPLLYGCYRGNENFCEPYVTKEKFDLIQDIMTRNIPQRKSSYTHIFSGMIICPICGRKLVGATSYHNYKGKVTKRSGYRCNGYYHTKKETCDFKRTKVESLIEENLLEVIVPMMNEFVISSENQMKSNKPKVVDTKKIQAEIDRLNNMYLKGRISEDMYDKNYKELNDKLKTVDDAPKPVSPTIKNLLKENLHELYNSFSKEEKQVFLRTIIKEIHIDEDYNITNIIFL
ncbi:MAG: recombinase family protein [Erysipelotrichaceae bacterium]|nr:recombinase family protein [Erysipelotrichaceae bacterium]